MMWGFQIWSSFGKMLSGFWDFLDLVIFRFISVGRQKGVIPSLPFLADHEHNEVCCIPVFFVCSAKKLTVLSHALYRTMCGLWKSHSYIICWSSDEKLSQNRLILENTLICRFASRTFLATHKKDVPSRRRAIFWTMICNLPLRAGILGRFGKSCVLSLWE